MKRLLVLDISVHPERFVLLSPNGTERPGFSVSDVMVIGRGSGKMVCDQAYRYGLGKIAGTMLGLNGFSILSFVQHEQTIRNVSPNNVFVVSASDATLSGLEHTGLSLIGLAPNTEDEILKYLVSGAMAVYPNVPCCLEVLGST